MEEPSIKFLLRAREGKQGSVAHLVAGRRDHTAPRVAVSSAAADMKAVAGDGGEGGGGGAFIAGKLFTGTRNP